MESVEWAEATSSSPSTPSSPSSLPSVPYTGFKNIYKLPAGHYIKFNAENKIVIKKYWDIIISETIDDEKSALEELDYLINDAVKLNLISDIPVGVMLSGGLDSSILGALMQKQMS